MKNAPQVVPSRVEYVSGKEQGVPGFGRGSQEGQPPPGPGNGGSSGASDNGVAAQELSQEQRIAHMLSESGHALVGRQSEPEASSNDADSKSPSRLNCPSPFGKDSQGRRLKKYENDDIPQEKVARIYQEELAKIMGRRASEEPRGPRDFASRYVWFG